MKNIKIALCGISASGKSTLAKNLANYNIEHIQGSSTLCKLGNIDKDTLKNLDIESKNILREKFLEYLSKVESKKPIIVDSHYCFPLESKIDEYDIAMSKKDFLIYDVILFLYTDSKIIQDRMLKQNYKNISLDLIDKWQEYELNALRQNAKKYNKIFSVINDNYEYVASFINHIANNQIESNLDSIEILPHKIFKKFFDTYKNRILESKKIILTDCDGTLSVQDGVKEFYKQENMSDFKIPNAFNHRFYGLYQFFSLTKKRLEINEQSFKNACESVAKNIKLSDNIINAIKNTKYPVIVLTAGIREIWNLKFIESNLDFLIVANDRFSVISQETKGYFASEFRKLGFEVIAIGDGPVDTEMLENANKALLIETNLNIANKNLYKITHNTLAKDIKGIIC